MPVVAEQLKNALSDLFCAGWQTELATVEERADNSAIVLIALWRTGCI